MTTAEDPTPAHTAGSRRQRIRRRVATTVAVAMSLTLSFAVAGMLGMDTEPPLLPTWLSAFGVALGMVVSVVIVWRHRYPELITGLALVPSVFAAPPVPALVSLAALAAARRDRNLWLATGGVFLVTVWTMWLDTQRSVPASMLQEPFGADPDGPRVAVPILAPILFAVLFTGIPLAVGLLRGTKRDLVRGAHTERELRDEVARKDERTRIAREMHDVLGHRLSQLSLQAGALEAGSEDNPDTAESARTVRTTSRAALDDLRQVIGVLRDGRELGSGPDDETAAPVRPQPTLADLPELITASRRSGLTVQTTVLLDDPTNAPGQLGTACYRVVQESLTNVLKHAPDCPVDVTIKGGPDAGVSIDIVNPLPETPAANGSGSGSGLTGISERVTAMDGTVSTAPTDSGEFAVAVWFPWPR